jgi:hypothetical protein
MTRVPISSLEKTQLQRYLPALEQLRQDLESRFEEDLDNLRWTPQHAQAARQLLEATVCGWRDGGADLAVLEALRALSGNLSNVTATVVRGSLDVIQTWCDEIREAEKNTASDLSLPMQIPTDAKLP